LSVVSELVVTERNTNQSPIIKNGSKRRKSSRRIEESDTEEITSPEPNTLDVDEEVQKIIKLTTKSTYPQVDVIDEVILLDSSPRKRAIAVEIRTKPPPRRSTKSKKPLEEIIVENIPTPEPRPPKVPTTQRQDVLMETREDLENVVLAIAPSTPRPKEREMVEVVKPVVEMSPPRPMNVASILAKSPNRPAYRVGLSKRVNVEPLHGYLKRKAL